MKRKRRIATREVYKWKARLNLHGEKQEYGVKNYWEPYAATLLLWPPIRFMLTLALLKGWSSCQIDFTLAYPQADAECDFTWRSLEVSKCLKVVGTLTVSRLFSRKSMGIDKPVEHGHSTYAKG